MVYHSQNENITVSILTKKKLYLKNPKTTSVYPLTEMFYK